MDNLGKIHRYLLLSGSSNGGVQKSMGHKVSGGRAVPTKRLFKENAPFIFFILVGSFAQTLFSRTLLPRPILFYSGQILNAKVLENLVWSNTSGLQFWGPLARTNFLSALCGLPKVPWKTGMLICHPVTLRDHSFSRRKKQFISL